MHLSCRKSKMISFSKIAEFSVLHLTLGCKTTDKKLLTNLKMQIQEGKLCEVSPKIKF